MHITHLRGTSSASIVRGTRVFQQQLFLLDQPLCSLWYKMCACNRIHHQKRKRTGRTITITARTGTSGTATANGTTLILYRCLIPLGLSNWTPPRTEPWLGCERRPGKKYGGRSREVDTMKVWCRRTRSRGSVSTATTTTKMITTGAADRAESLLRDMKEYVPDLIPTTEVLDLLLRCYSN